MRVIAGLYRSRLLAAPPGVSTRPTSDRLRETLYNVLAPRIPGARFADLFAGSGAVGIEAISRGAAEVAFFENAPAALAALRANLASLRIEVGYRVHERSVFAGLRSLASRSPAWNIVFLDPPYDAADAYRTAFDLLAENASALLAPDAIVVAEHRRRMPVPLRTSYGQLARYRLLEQGDAALSFFSVNNEVETGDPS